MNKKPSPKIPPKPITLSLRLPGPIHQLLTEAAGLEHTSMNSLAIRYISGAARNTINKHRQMGMFDKTGGE